MVKRCAWSRTRKPRKPSGASMSKAQRPAAMNGDARNDVACAPSVAIAGNRHRINDADGARDAPHVHHLRRDRDDRRRRTWLQHRPMAARARASAVYAIHVRPAAVSIATKIPKREWRPTGSTKADGVPL